MEFGLLCLLSYIGSVFLILGLEMDFEIDSVNPLH